jgi:hypothetical protein
MKGFDITIWVLPHRARFARWLVNIDSDFVEERQVGFLQELDISRPWELDIDRPFIEFPVQMEDAQALRALLDASNYPLRARTVPQSFSETIHGLRINQSLHEFSVQWHGRLVEEDRDLMALYNAVAKLAERSGEPDTSTLQLLAYGELRQQPNS